MRNDNYGYSNKIGGVDSITNNHQDYPSVILRQAIRDVHAV